MTIAQHNLNWAAQRAQCRTRDEVHCYRSDKPNHSANKLDRAAARLRTMRGEK